MYNNRAEILRRLQELVTDPQQVSAFLTREWNAGAHAGVYEKVVAAREMIT